MCYSILLHYPELAPEDLGAGGWEGWERAFDAYATALDQAGVLLSAEVLQPSSSTTTVSVRDGKLRVPDHRDRVKTVTAVTAAVTKGQLVPPYQRNELLVRPVHVRAPIRGGQERGPTMTTSTAAFTGNDVAAVERDLRRMELLNRREHRIRSAGRPVPVISYLKLAARPRDRWRGPDA